MALESFLPQPSQKLRLRRLSLLILDPPFPSHFLCFGAFFFFFSFLLANGRLEDALELQLHTRVPCLRLRAPVPTWFRPKPRRQRRRSHQCEGQPRGTDTGLPGRQRRKSSGGRVPAAQPRGTRRERSVPLPEFGVRVPRGKHRRAADIQRAVPGFRRRTTEGGQAGRK